MPDLVQNVQHEFWRPPARHAATEPVLADACRRCDTEFIGGAAFCHICGGNRQRADALPAGNLTKHFEFVRSFGFARLRDALALPWPALCGFMAGIGFLIVAMSLGLMSVHDYSDFEAIQLWRIQWLMAACAAFLAGILLKNRKREN